jgi:hypothetical protein
MRKNEELRQRISERELKKRESCACSISEREKEEIRTRAAAEGKNKREAKNKVRWGSCIKTVPAAALLFIFGHVHKSRALLLNFFKSRPLADK